MPKPEMPSHRNLKTGLLRCPINGFKDCVKEQCMFWISAEKDSFIKAAIMENPPAPSTLEATCLMLTAAELFELVLLDVASSRASAVSLPDVLGAILDRMLRNEESLAECFRLSWKTLDEMKAA